MSRPPPIETLRLPLGHRDEGAASRVRRLLATALVAAAFAVALLGVARAGHGVPGEKLLRTAVALGLVALAAAVHNGLGTRRAGAGACLVVDSAGVQRAQGDSTTALALWGEAFGLSVFASADMAQLLFAFTSPLATRFVSVCRRPEDAPISRRLLERAVTASDTDLAGVDGSLSLGDAERLLSAVARMAPSALERVYLSDASGEPLTLDPAELKIGPERIDLLAPLEWRAFFFQERGAQAASVCQATWVRQGDVELVLVAPMPGDSSWLGATRAAVNAQHGQLPSEARSTLVRDVRLMQASAGEPPPREQRRAIDRLFMLPMRRALDGAPRTARSRPSLHETC